MAYTDSDFLPMGSTWRLGQYSIRCFETTEAGVKYVLAHISGPEGNAQTGILVDSGEQIRGWYANANKTEITVYAEVETPLIQRDVDLSEVYSAWYSYGPWGNRYWPDIAVWADFPARVFFNQQALDAQTSSPITLSYSEEKKRYVGNIDINGSSALPEYGPATLNYLTIIPAAPYPPISETYQVMVARFPINIRDAGGGPEGSDPSWGSDVNIWDEPGDVDYDREPDEPTRTLHLMAQGATSGRHNDPIVDPSYSDIPNPKDTVKADGNGGDGGDGGGGGAGASTLVTRPFGTGKADNKEIILHSRRHGYGSTGGKGGKAGDGCILIYYRTEE